MEKHTITLGGQVYNLPPFNAGQMRRKVDPLMQETKELLARVEGITEPTNADALDLTMCQRDIARRQAELVLAAIQNQYPHLTLEDVETLTPSRIAQLFNEIMMLTTLGDNEPGEAKPPIRKRSR